MRGLYTGGASKHVTKVSQPLMLSNIFRTRIAYKQQQFPEAQFETRMRAVPYNSDLQKHQLPLTTFPDTVGGVRSL